MINTIIFSKNRACQLDLLLRNFNMRPVVVIYTHDPEFASGYDDLIGMYPDVVFAKQTDLKQQILENLGEYTMFEVDDTIMIDQYDKNCKEFVEFKTNLDILCFSLRLAPDYRGAPKMDGNKWAWKGLKHSWGYPMSVSSTIFRKEDIVHTIEQTNLIEIPNDLEKSLRKTPPDRPLMICLDKPKLITNEANIVQHKYPTPNFGVDLTVLEERFLKGERLSLEYMKAEALKAKWCFMRMGYQWEREGVIIK